MQVDDMRLCFVGDSFVHGTNDPEYLGWTGRVSILAWARGHQLTCYNLGVRRDTSSEIAARWESESQRRLPDLLYVLRGLFVWRQRHDDRGQPHACT